MENEKVWSTDCQPLAAEIDRGNTGQVYGLVGKGMSNSLSWNGGVAKNL